MGELTQEMRQLLARASVVAEGPAAKIDPNKTGGHAKPGGVEPRGSNKSLPDLMLAKWSGATSEGQQRRVERECAEMLDLARRNPGPTRGLREVGTLPWKREVAEEAEHAKNADEIGRVANRYSISRATVYNYRRLYGEKAA